MENHQLELYNELVQQKLILGLKSPKDIGS